MVNFQEQAVLHAYVEAFHHLPVGPSYHDDALGSWAAPLISAQGTGHNSCTAGLDGPRL